MMQSMDILEKIIEQKRREVADSGRRSIAENWAELAKQTPRGADFEAALRQPGRIRVIAEIKQASPSAGILRANFQPAEIAVSYQRGGADALSVLTDEKFFQGSLADLKAARKAVTVPILRKDFLIDPVQVYEAKIAGASACLLIAECLEPQPLAELVAFIHSLEMTALVELFDPRYLPAVIESGTRLIGINNRNLRTFETHLNHTLDLLPEIPTDRLVVSESGIKTRADVERLAEAGVGALLVGETFMRAADPGAKLAELLGLPLPH